MPFIYGGGGDHNSGDLKFFRRVVIVIVLLHVTVGLIALCWTLRVLVIDVVLAITVASAIAPLAESLEKRKIPRFLTVAGTYVLIIGFYVSVAFALAQPFKEQALHFSAQLPHYTRELRAGYNEVLRMFGDKDAREADGGAHDTAPDSTSGPASGATPGATSFAAPDVAGVQTGSGDAQPRGYSGILSMVKNEASRFVDDPNDLRSPALKLLRQTMDVTAGLMGLFLNGILVLFFAGYFVVEANHIWDRLLLWVPRENRERARSLISPLGARMGGYVRGQILVSTAVGSIFAVGLTLIGVKYGLVLGLLAGILNLLPFVGSMITTVLACFVAANQGLVPLGLTLSLFAVEQTIESNFIVPHLLGKQVDLHPLVVLFSILIGATIAGAVGALASVPIAAAVIFLAQEFYLKPLNAGDPDADCCTAEELQSQATSAPDTESGSPRSE